MKTILLLSTFLLLNCVRANNSIRCTAKYFVDSGSTKTFDNFNKLPAKILFEVKNYQFGYQRNTAVWCVFKFENSENSKQQFSLNFDNIFLDSLSFFDPMLQSYLGDRTNGVSKYGYTYAFPITLAAGEKKQVVVRIKKIISFLDFSYKIAKNEDLQQTAHFKTIYLTLFFGINFFMLLVYLVISILQNKRRFYQFFVYAVFSSIYILVTTGYMKFSIFPNFIYYSELRIYSGSLWFISLLSFISFQLELFKFQPNIYKLIRISNITNLIIIGTTFCLLIEHQFSLLNIFMSVGYVNFLSSIVLISLASIKHLKIDKKNAVFLFIGLIPHFVWSSSVIFRSFGLLPISISEGWLVYINLYEVLFFSILLIQDHLAGLRKNETLNTLLSSQQDQKLQEIASSRIQERRKIASLIHDNFGSQLSYLSLLAEQQKPETLKKELTKLSNELRSLSHNILPKSLDDGALFSSLKQQIEYLNGYSDKTIIRLENYDFPELIEDNLAQSIYLISLEIINNSLKHGLSSNVTIELYGYPDMYVFQFTDNGIGFDTNLVKNGFGLNSIEERIQQLNGFLEINSIPNEGTIIQITITIPEK